MIATRLAERLRARFPGLADPKLSDPDQIVAKGAVLFAASKVAESYDGQAASGAPKADGLLGGSVPKIVNITSRGYGLRTYRSQNDEEGYISWQIKPNDALPVDHRDTYKTLFPNQTEVDIVLYESATDELTESVAVNKELAKAVLSGFPLNQPAGQPLEVTFSLGDESILRVHAVGPTGKDLHVEVEIAGAAPAEEL
nr:Hsp70 family protein [Micromonospora sp. DSM 115978]